MGSVVVVKALIKCECDEDAIGCRSLLRSVGQHLSHNFLLARAPIATTGDFEWFLKADLRVRRDSKCILNLMDAVDTGQSLFV